MKMVEVTDVATREITAVNLDEIPLMETVGGPAGTMVTRLTFRSGHKVEVYESISEIKLLARLRREPLGVPGQLH
jgi:hypothetical protein